MGKFFHRSKGNSSAKATPDTLRSSIDPQSTPRSASNSANTTAQTASSSNSVPSTPVKKYDAGTASPSDVSAVPRKELAVQTPNEGSTHPVINVGEDAGVIEGPVERSTQNSNQLSVTSSTPLRASMDGDRLSLRSKKENKGILSSLVSAAHNAATIITLSMDDERRNGLTALLGNRSMLARALHDTADSENHSRSFSTKLDFLLKPARFHGLHSSTSSLERNAPDSAEQQAPANADKESQLGKQEPENTKSATARSLSPSNVHFELVRESPVNTIGLGNLLLAHFAASRPPATTMDSVDSTIKKGMMPQEVNSQLPALSQLAVSGAGESKKVRRRSYLSPARSLDRVLRNDVSDGDLASDGEDSATSDDDLDQIIDYNDQKLASEKENKEFHQAFRDLPSNERLVDDFSCALSREILVQGRMYLSEHYVCFNSSILGWVTNIRIPLQEVIQIEKRSTAKLFPNGMIVRTLHRKYVFASFLSRDLVFRQVTNAWHKVLMELADVDPLKVAATRGRARSRSLVTKYALDGGTNDENSTNSADVSEYSDGQGSDTDESLVIDDQESDTSSIEVKAQPENNLLAKDSTNDSDKDKDKDKDAADGNTFRGLALAGPLSHEPTDINYSKQSQETFICDENISAPLGVVFLLLFGSDTSKYIKILKNQKNFDIDESGVVELSKSNKTRHYTYTKPLSGPIGPKQTKCIIDDKLIDFDLESYVLVEQDTSTPDVPNGNSFKVKTKMFLSWGANNSTRIYVLTAVEWLGKSWIKGAIEKGSIDGQKESMKLMIETLNDLVATAGSKGAKGDKKKKQKRRKSTSSGQRELPPDQESAPPPPLGVLEQLSKLMEAIGGLVPVLLVGKTATGSIVSVLFLVLFGFVFSRLLVGSSSLMDVLSQSSMITQVKINDKTFTMIPSVDSYLADRRRRLDTEVSLWKWINDRLDGHIRIQSDLAPQGTAHKLREYSAQELKDIVQITQLKLNELSKRLDASDE